MADAVSGCVFLDKPPGVSSFAALHSVKSAFETRRVGHTGTLDPFASGLLIALVGRATRAAQFIVGLDKTYRTTITFGCETDTDDSTGTSVRQAPPPPRADVEAAIARFVGTFGQIPPAFSAVHVGGRRAYKLARQGAPPSLQARTVVVREFSIRSWDETALEATICCSSGTYIRALARDLGRDVDSAAHVTELRRTAIGPFAVDEAKSPSDVVPKDLLDVGEVLLRLPEPREVTVTDHQAQRIRHGGELLATEVVDLLADSSDPVTEACETATPVIIRSGGRTIALASWDGRHLAYRGILETGSSSD